MDPLYAFLCNGNFEITPYNQSQIIAWSVLFVYLHSIKVVGSAECAFKIKPGCEYQEPKTYAKSLLNISCCKWFFEHNLKPSPLKKKKK